MIHPLFRACARLSLYGVLTLATAALAGPKDGNKVPPSKDERPAVSSGRSSGGNPGRGSSGSSGGSSGNSGGSSGNSGGSSGNSGGSSGNSGGSSGNSGGSPGNSGGNPGNSGGRSGNSGGGWGRGGNPGGGNPGNSGGGNSGNSGGGNSGNSGGGNSGNSGGGNSGGGWGRGGNPGGGNPGNSGGGNSGGGNPGHSGGGSPGNSGGGWTGHGPGGVGNGGNNNGDNGHHCEGNQGRGKGNCGPVPGGTENPGGGTTVPAGGSGGVPSGGNGGWGAGGGTQPAGGSTHGSSPVGSGGNTHDSSSPGSNGSTGSGGWDREYDHDHYDNGYQPNHYVEGGGYHPRPRSSGQGYVDWNSYIPHVDVGGGLGFNAPGGALGLELLIRPNDFLGFGVHGGVGMWGNRISPVVHLYPFGVTNFGLYAEGAFSFNTGGDTTLRVGGVDQPVRMHFTPAVSAAIGYRRPWATWFWTSVKVGYQANLQFGEKYRSLDGVELNSNTQTSLTFMSPGGLVVGASAGFSFF